MLPLCGFVLEKFLLKSKTYKERTMQDNQAQKFMEQAIKLATDGVKAKNGGPFGAIIIKNGIIIGRGHNSVTSTNDPTAHAEIVAIRDACKNLGTFQLEGCELYTSCEPCPMCLGAIYWARPLRVYYSANRKNAADHGFDDAFIYDEVSKPLTERKIPMIQLLQEKALIPFLEWEKITDKIEY